MSAMSAVKSSDEHIQYFELFLSFKGRLSRRIFWRAFLVIFFSYLNCYLLLNLFTSVTQTQGLYLFLPFFFAYLAISVKRLHDLNQSGYRLFWFILPVLGPLFLNIQLFFRGGNDKKNYYGLRTHQLKFDYFKNPDLETQAEKIIVNDITQLNPVVVSEVFIPKSIPELVQFIKSSNKPLCIGGGRFSMGGHTASAGAIHIDMRQLNQILQYSLEEKTVRVQAGIRWCDIQQFTDQFDLSIMIMQTYSNFTVGGSLSVNVHGRYIGLGPVVLSVREILLILANGETVTASPTINSHLFYGAIGGYGGIGIIAEATLSLAQNDRAMRTNQRMTTDHYLNYFKEKIRLSTDVIFHNADIYPPKFKRLNAISWTKTEAPSSLQTSIQSVKRVHPVAKYFIWSVSKAPFGNWRREFVIDPLLYFKKIVHHRNYEAGYNVAELAPISGKNFTWVLQEYFVPIDLFEKFLPLISEILQRYKVEALNISIRHAKQDPGTLLAWARKEVFAFVLYYRQGTSDLDINKVGIWTREIIAAVIQCEGSYYLPYQLHATIEQFHQAYPNSKKFFALKEQIDPNYRFQNQLWNKYYLGHKEANKNMQSIYKIMLDNPTYHDKLYLFLQNIFHLYQEDKYFALIKEVAQKDLSDREIYQHIQARIGEAQPFMAGITYALPALFKQKNVIVAQTLQLLGNKTKLSGYVEIGSKGRYISGLQKKIKVEGPVYLFNDTEPSNSIIDMIDREQIKKIGTYLALDNDNPLLSNVIADGSIDLVTCYVGLHHVPLDKLPAFIDSIARVLRKGGQFILREHDCVIPEMKTFCALIHDVFNIGTDVTVDANEKELRYFRSVAEWFELLKQHGFSTRGERLLQDNDPSDNTLLIFVKD